MGLITKTVMIKWNPKNKGWYEDKGYIFTKWKDEFEVKVEDLPHGSGIHVIVQCDCCNKFLPPMEWKNYKKNVKANGVYYCNKCSIILLVNDDYLNHKIKTFYDWCLEYNRFDILLRWNYELNMCSPQDIIYSTTKKYWFNCPRNIHPSELKTISGFTNGYDKVMDCKMCNSIGQYIVDTYGQDDLEKYWDYEKNKNINPFKVGKSIHKKVWIKCQEKEYHDSYPIDCVSFTQGSRCPLCSHHHGKVHPLDSLGKLLENRGLLKVWSGKNKKSPYEYAPMSGEQVYWKCLDDKHEDYKRDIKSSNTYDFRCPKCVQERSESMIQEKVRLYLESLDDNYTILHEYNCTITPKNPKYKSNRYTMPFDNEIKELKLIIEVHGVQHYNELSGLWFSNKFDLHKRKLYDRYKRMYAKSKGYYYLEIPYWDIQDNNNYKKIINNKLKEIN